MCMYVYVYVYIYVYIYVYVCSYVYMCVCIYIYIYVLHIYETFFIHKLIEEGNIEYISKLDDKQEDLIHFENANIANDINKYHKDMVKKNTNLAITITDNQYYYKSYDKRKEFNFSSIII